MSDEPSFPRNIFGLHEPGGEHLMEQAGRPGWIVFTHGLGRDPNDQNGLNYRPWSDRGFGIIARLNHGYGSAGTIPQPVHYDAFAQRVCNFVAHSPGCHVWIIGNEMNHAQERPDGQIITPAQYASCYAKCWQQIHNLPGHDRDQVAIGAVAPWNNTTSYPGNEAGDWIAYFVDILSAIKQLGTSVDALALHTYTHGSEPSLVFSEQRMSPPFQNRRYNFRCYRDFMDVIPQELWYLPVYITESNQDQEWENANRGWVRNAYREIDDWNTVPGHQQIRALVLYRWPKYDKWYIDGKGAVHDDFRAAMANDYTWTDVKPPIVLYGHVVQGAFLDFFSRLGEALVGMPISDELVEDGLSTQYFENMILQQDASGVMTLKKAGAEVVSLREAVRLSDKQIRSLRCEVELLKNRIGELEMLPEPRPGQPVPKIAAVVRPLWDTLIYQLAQHKTKRYPSRDLAGVKYIVISHSAVPGTFTAVQIADFHVKHMHWPGIGYHFYIDGNGRVQHTNALITSCHHVGTWDPISIGICVGGNFTADVPTAQQLQSTGQLVAWLLQELGLSLDALKGKQELVDTQSPGRQWLQDRKWKTLLIDAVNQARADHTETYSPKPLYHYLYLGQRGEQWTDADWQATSAFGERFKVTQGFSIDDARQARYVTIVGGLEQVDGTKEELLLTAGCRVERIVGRSTADTAQILRGMAQSGRQFLSLLG